jgi:tRNA A-37 threonylcarbamoyl transferase component Bud32
MSRFTPFLVSALAATTPLAHCIAVPATPLQAVPDKFLQVREPIAFAAPVQIGDLLSFHNGQLLRRNNETAQSEVFARESVSDSLEKRAVVVKRADPKWPKPPGDYNDDVDDFEQEGVLVCGEMGKAFLGERLGGGSSGQVYKAIDEKNKIIAVKMVLNRKDRDREYDITKKVDDNSHIVKVLGKCQQHGAYYPIALELIEGETLAKRIDSKVYSSMRALCPGDSGFWKANNFLLELQAENSVKLVVKQVFDAIAHAHSKGVAHVDLKGDNIIMSLKEADKATVIDFGEATTESKVKELKPGGIGGGIQSPGKLVQVLVDDESNG